jgi:hypothetical protein
MQPPGSGFRAARLHRQVGDDQVLSHGTAQEHNVINGRLADGAH